MIRGDSVRELKKKEKIAKLEYLPIKGTHHTTKQKEATHIEYTAIERKT